MKIAITTLLMAGHAGIALAGGTAVGEQNAVSAATGGAGAARAEDAGAAWHIPAALADDGGWRVGVGLALAHPSLEARAADGTWSTDSASSWATPPHIDASYAHGRWAAGLALGVPFGGGVTWPSTWPGASEAVRTDLMIVRAAPFAAYRLGSVRVAAGVHLDAGRLQIERGLDFIDMTGDVRLDLAGQGAGVDASVYWQASPAAALGLAFRSRTTIAFHGNANFTTPDAFAAKTPDQTARTTMTLPDQLVLGGHVRRGALAVLGDIEYTHWSVNRTTEIDFQMDQTPNAMQRDDWHDTVTLRAGVEYVPAASPRITVRGGGYLDPSPVPADRLTPTAPDATRVAATAGLSYRISRAWTADAFGEQMWLLRRESSSVETMPASYGGSALVIGAGVRWMR